jgi:hypothetical protein
MTTETHAARAAAQLREALAHLALLARGNSRVVADGVGAWADLARDLADDYVVHLDGLNGNRGLRYVAVARSLAVRPYAVITSDPQELRDTLASGHGTLPAHGNHGQATR